MSAVPSAAYSRRADLLALRWRALAFDTFELVGLGLFLLGLALVAKAAGA